MNQLMIDMLDKFGEILIQRVRDKAIEDWEKYSMVG